VENLGDQVSVNAMFKTPETTGQWSFRSITTNWMGDLWATDVLDIWKLDLFAPCMSWWYC
jgi:hypothetical protein